MSHPGAEFFDDRVQCSHLDVLCVVHHVVGSEQISRGIVRRQKGRERLGAHDVDGLRAHCRAERAVIHEPVGIRLRLFPQDRHHLSHWLERYNQPRVPNLFAQEVPILSRVCADVEYAGCTQQSKQGDEMRADTARHDPCGGDDLVPKTATQSDHPFFYCGYHAGSSVDLQDRESS